MYDLLRTVIYSFVSLFPPCTTVSTVHHQDENIYGSTGIGSSWSRMSLRSVRRRRPAPSMQQEFFDVVIVEEKCNGNVAMGNELLLIPRGNIIGIGGAPFQAPIPAVSNAPIMKRNRFDVITFVIVDAVVPYSMHRLFGTSVNQTVPIRVINRDWALDAYIDPTVAESNAT
jgi:hypothetical protein